MDSSRTRLSGEERKELILNAACKLFAENGYEKTSTKQLAKAANCSEALLYKYFENKKAIIDTLLDEWITDQNRKNKLDIIDNSALVTLRNHYKQFVAIDDTNQVNPTTRANLINALNSTPYYREKAWEAFLNGTDMFQNTIIPIIKFGQEQGEIKKGDPQIMANLFVGYMVGAREISSNFHEIFTPIDFDILLQVVFR